MNNNTTQLFDRISKHFDKLKIHQSRGLRLFGAVVNVFALHSRTLDGYSVTVILKSRNSVTKTDLHCRMYKILINKKKLFLPFLSLNII